MLKHQDRTLGCAVVVASVVTRVHSRQCLQMLNRVGRARCSVAPAVLLIIVCVLAACSAGSARSDNDARLALLRSLPAARLIPHNSVLVADHTSPLCSVDHMPSGQFSREFRVDGSVERALTEVTGVLTRARWRVRARKGESAGRGVWFDRRFAGWTAVAILLTRTTSQQGISDERTGTNSQLTISFAALSDKSC
jgi:hypothetical protein